jgi:leucyl-tRNA synthetase
VYLTNPANILPAGKKADQKTLKRFHLFLKNYQERLNDYKVNTAVSAAMEFLNDLTGNKAVLDREIVQQFLTAFSVMVPHFSSELLEKLLGVQLKDCVWPEFNSELASIDEVEIAIQINGKLRATIVVSKTLSNDEVAQLATQAAKQWLEGKEVLKQIVVPHRLVSFVIK